MYEFNKNELDKLVVFLDSKIIVDEYLFNPVKNAIKKSMNSNYTEHSIEACIKKEQNLRDSMYLIDKHINNFKGIVLERVEMFIYNYLKNDTGIVTITNPDPTSKSDLIHIHNKTEYFFSSCGPDIKYGNPSYIVDQYIEKHLKRENSSGFVDITGYLHPDDYRDGFGFKKLQKSENKKIQRAVLEYGYKPTIPSVLPKMEYDNIFNYYLHYLTTGKLPSESNYEDVKDIGKKVINNEFNCLELKQQLIPNQSEISVSDIPELFEEIKKRKNEGNSTVKKNKDLASDNKETEKRQVTRKKNTLIHNTSNKVGKYSPKIFIGGVAIAGIVAVANPKSREYIFKNISKINLKKIKDKSKLFLKKSSMKGKTRNIASVATNNFDILKPAGKKIGDKIVETSPSIIANTVGIVNADKVSSFRPLLDAYKNKLISKEQFFQMSKDKLNDKDVRRYLRLMVNFFKDEAAIELLK